MFLVFIQTISESIRANVVVWKFILFKHVGLFMYRFTRSLMNSSWRKFPLNIVANKRLRYSLHVFGKAFLSVRKSLNVPEGSLFLSIRVRKRSLQKAYLFSVECIRLITCVRNVTNVQHTAVRDSSNSCRSLPNSPSCNWTNGRQ